MKNEFNPGAYCRFPNEEIPHILDILRANGHNVSDYEHASLMDQYIVVTESLGIFRVSIPGRNELSRHGFMVKALRLEHGTTLSSKNSTQQQRMHIHNELDKLGISVYEGADYSIDYPDLYFDGEHITGRKPLINGGSVFVSYDELCRRLCIDPIVLSSQHVLNEVLPNDHPMKEPTLEDEVNALQPVFDPSKPFEVSDDGVEWDSLKSEEYCFFDTKRNHYVLYDTTEKEYTTAKLIRNIPEFNASMLQPGEHMVVTYVPGRTGMNDRIVVRSGDRIVDIYNGSWQLVADDIKGRKLEPMKTFHHL